MTDADIKQSCIERWATIISPHSTAPDCESCGQEVSYSQLEELAPEERKHYVHYTHKSGAVRHCLEHRELAHPWAADLDPGKVRTWLAEAAAKWGGEAFLIDWDDLRERCMP